MRLYCFPHAGATASAYRRWSAPGLAVRGVDPPGRGSRAREPRAGDFRELVAALTDHVVADLGRAGGAPRYFTFGHSFGALLSLAVGAAVADVVGQPPIRAVLSASLPPARHAPVDEAAALSDAQLLDRIAAVGGTPPELLAGGALTAHVVRRVREDYAIRGQFHRQTGLRVDFPITIVAARDDPHAPPEQMWEWSVHSRGPARRVVIPGGHFAAIEEPHRVLDILTEEVYTHAG